MVTNTIILLLLLAVAIMPLSFNNGLTQEELSEMGIHLENSSPLETR